MPSIDPKAQRVLVISDSLGTPIHARGIFHFTTSVVQIMREFGHDLTLLVEPPETGASGQEDLLQEEGVAAHGRHYAALCDILRHFEGARFGFDWGYHDPGMQSLALRHRDVANFRLALIDTENAGRNVSVEIDAIAKRELRFNRSSDHLKLFDRLMCVKEAYSESFRRANLTLRPVTVDASGFDLVYLDTPHYIAVHGIDRSKITCVVHDFIPFFDVDMGYDWRRLFEKKIDCSLRQAGHLVFNSNTTKDYFDRIYGPIWEGRQSIIYPPNRIEVEQAVLQGRRGASQYLHDIVANKHVEAQEWVRQAEGVTNDKQQRRSRWRPERGSSWNPALPFFCSILSDEPRKNVKAIVEASKDFQGRANFVVMGQLDGNRYMHHRPWEYPNLHFTGYVSDQQKFDLLRSATGFIFPSLSEGFGIPIIEAAMFGTPVICTDIPVFREITFGKGSYFAPGDSDSLRSHITALLAKSRDSDRSDELKALAVATFSQTAAVDRVRSLFEAEVA